MAASDYYLCDICHSKAFYDADITDPHYFAAFEVNPDVNPIGITAICEECNKTHKCVVIER